MTSQLSTPCCFRILHPTLPRSFSKRLFVDFIDLSSSVRCKNSVIPLWCLFNEEKSKSHKIAFLLIVMLSSVNLPWCNVKKSWYVARSDVICNAWLLDHSWNNCAKIIQCVIVWFLDPKTQYEILWMNSQSAYLNDKSHLVLLFFYLFS